MAVDPKRVQAVFLAAVEHDDPTGRADVVDRECGADLPLRHRVEALLRAHDQPDSDLDELVTTDASLAAMPPSEPGAERGMGVPTDPIEATRDLTPSQEDIDRPAYRPITEGPARIGAYKLREKIGEGGMGVVYLAEQEMPVRRRVALKIIKPGMDTEQVVTRFEAERQALALMDHPSIARVFDAGATDTGRPYFVMELVKGVPITEYCDTVHLSPKDRLALFIPVCQAIQHAHQKGIIHRDVKPTNVLVTMQDGKPVPKIIDFGIAKATEQRLTERSLFTQHGMVMGTLARLADVQQANMATTKALAETIEAKKATDAALTQSEEARTQAKAVSKYLVESFRKPDPSQDGKELKVVDLLDQAEAQLDAEFTGSPKINGELLNALGQTYLGLGLPEKAGEVLTKARAVREAALGFEHPDTLESRNNLGEAYRTAGRTAEAIAMHVETLRLRMSKLGPDHKDALTSRGNLALSYLQAGRTVEAIAMAEETLKLCVAKLGPDHPTTLINRNNLAETYDSAGRTREAITMLEETLKLSTSKLGPDHPNTLITQVNLGISYRNAGRPAEGARLMERALERATGRPDVLAYLARARPQLAAAYEAAGEFARAEPFYRDGLEQARKQFGPNDLRSAGAMASLGLNLLKQQKFADAEPMLRECLGIREMAQPDEWSTFNARSLLRERSLFGQKKYAESEPLLLSGYAGLKTREAKIPVPAKPRLPEAGERVVKLYEAWGQPDKAREWRKKLGLKASELPSNVFAR